MGEKKMENRRGVGGFERAWWGRTRVGPSDWGCEPWLGNGQRYGGGESAASRLRFASTTPGRVGGADVRQGNNVHGM